MIEWSGYVWDQRTWDGGPSKDVLWAAKNVSIDSDGHLHLKVTRNTDGRYISAEIDSRKVSWGYGTYRITTRGRLDKLPKGVVFGLFTYGESPENANWEIDLEASAWGVGEVRWDHTYFTVETNGQKANVLSRIPVSERELFIHEIVWEPNTLTWRTYDEQGTVRETRTSRKVPTPGKELFIINLWVYEHMKTQPCEVVVESFDFTPYE